MELYHVMNRGVDKRNIVMDDRDRKRFVRDLYEMNNIEPVTNLWYTASNPFNDIGRHYDGRKKLVDIHAWCLMGNHYHLLLSERIEGGMSVFLKKLNMGYAKYFNARHARSGALFQGKTKRVLIKRDAHFLYILLYIHCNPLDFMKGGNTWKSQSLARPGAALTWLGQYRWSSYHDYLDNGEFTAIVDGSDLYAHRKDHAREIRHYLTSAHDFSQDDTNLE